MQKHIAGKKRMEGEEEEEEKKRVSIKRGTETQMGETFLRETDACRERSAETAGKQPTTKRKRKRENGETRGRRGRGGGW